MGLLGLLPCVFESCWRLPCPVNALFPSLSVWKPMLSQHSWHFCCVHPVAANNPCLLVQSNMFSSVAFLIDMKMNMNTRVFKSEEERTCHDGFYCYNKITIGTLSQTWKHHSLVVFFCNLYSFNFFKYYQIITSNIKSQNESASCH